MVSSNNPSRGWSDKFRDALRGTAIGIRGQSSFYIHFSVAAVVVMAGFVLDLDLLQWCLLTLCIATVVTAEMFNSSLEWLAKAVDQEPNHHIGAALDTAAAAVLIAATGAGVTGALVFVVRIGQLMGW